VATAALSPADIAVAIRSRLRRQRNATVLMTGVEEVGVTHNILRLEDGGVLAFDWLIVATGADYSFFGRPDWAEHALVLKSLDDALAIRRRLLEAFERAELRAVAETPAAPVFAIVGGGPTGVEMAGAIAEMARVSLAGDFRRIDPARTRILLIEAGPRLLPAFPDRLSRYCCKALQGLGVEVRLGQAVSMIGPDAVTIGGERLEVDAILWCAGVEARPAAAWLGVSPARNGAVPVGRNCAIEGRPNIFVLGDVAAHPSHGTLLPGLAPVAKQQGRYVAGIVRAYLGEKPVPGPFVYKDWGALAVIGRCRAVATFGRLSLTGFPAWAAWSLIHLMLLADFRSRISVYMNWSWAWFTRGRSARLITRAPRAGTRKSEPRSGA
jgi:NADH dehydrogenase